MRKSAGIAFGALISLALLLQGCSQRILYTPTDPRDSVPHITLVFVDLATATVYEVANHGETLYVAPNSRLGVFARAGGENGIIELSLKSEVNGVLKATALVDDPIDSNGFVAAWLLITGTNGAGGPGDQPVQFDLLANDSATVTVIAVAPPNSGAEITVQVVTNCGCPTGAAFDKHCDCGCLPTGPLVVSTLTDLPLAPICGASCCKISDRCLSAGPTQRCGIDESLCPDGGRCTSPLTPVCGADNLCYPF